MRQKLISALATKFEGVEAKILGRVADNILKSKTVTTDEEVSTAVDGVTFSDILQSYGDARATDATKTAVLNYEKKYGIKEGRPVEQRSEAGEGEGGDSKEDKPKADEKDSAKAATQKNSIDDRQTEKALRSLLEPFTKKLDGIANEILAMKADKVTDTRRNRLNEVIKGLSEAERRPYSRIALDKMSDDDFEQLIGEATDDVQSIATSRKADGGTFNAPLGGQHVEPHGKEATEAEISDVIKNW